MKSNREYSTLRYYQGLIRDLEAQLKNALARIRLLEEQMNKLARISKSSPDNQQQFSYDAPSKFANTQGGTGGLNSYQIKSLISDWINNGELPIPVHDHTDSNKGGDAYANLGAALQ